MIYFEDTMCLILKKNIWKCALDQARPAHGVPRAGDAGSARDRPGINRGEVGGNTSGPPLADRLPLPRRLRRDRDGPGSRRLRRV